MTSKEKDRIGNLSDWYLSDQLNFDRKLIKYRYETIKGKLHGEHALELGPADGVMTEFLCEVFKTLTIVDGSKKLLDLIPERKNLTKINSLFEDFKPNRTFDTIIIEHVLEHVENPIDLLKNAREWLSPGGHVFIGVPNANSIHRLAAVKMGLLKTQYHLNDRDLSLGHRRVYSWDTLKNDINLSQLSIIEIGGVFFKPVSNNQIERFWTSEMIEGFFKLGKDFPELAAEIYAICV